MNRHWLIALACLILLLLILVLTLPDLTFGQNASNSLSSLFRRGQAGTDCIGQTADGFPVPFDQQLDRYRRPVRQTQPVRYNTPPVYADPRDPTSLGERVRAAAPGTVIEVPAGTYQGFTASPKGSPGRPIKVIAERTANRADYKEVKIIGGENKQANIFLQGAQYFILEGIGIRGEGVKHGIDINHKNGGSYCVVLRNIKFSSGGSEDCIKFAGMTGPAFIVGNHFRNCSDRAKEHRKEEGAAIDLVGSGRVFIMNNRFRDLGVGQGVQAKGGSYDVYIHGNEFFDFAGRAVNLGGSTKDDEFANPKWEGERIRVLANIFHTVGGNRPSRSVFVFDKCLNCMVANNTVVNPSSQLFLFANGSRGSTIVNNLFMYKGDIGIDGRPNGVIGNNLWFNISGPTRPPLRGENDIIGLDPELDLRQDAQRRTYRPMYNDSPLIRMGRPLTDLQYEGIKADHAQIKYHAQKPAIGAFECLY